jgi:transposase-like protein
MQIMSKHYPVEQRDRAVKMVLDHLCECRSVYAACQAIGPKVGVGEESLRRWVLQAQVDASQRPRSHDCRAAADQGPWSGRTEISRRPTLSSANALRGKSKVLRVSATGAPPSKITPATLIISTAPNA